MYYLQNVKIKLSENFSNYSSDKPATNTIPSVETLYNNQNKLTIFFKKIEIDKIQSG